MLGRLKTHRLEQSHDFPYRDPHGPLLLVELHPGHDGAGEEVEADEDPEARQKVRQGQVREEAQEALQEDRKGRQELRRLAGGLEGRSLQPELLLRFPAALPQGAHVHVQLGHVLRRADEHEPGPHATRAQVRSQQEAQQAHLRSCHVRRGAADGHHQGQDRRLGLGKGDGKAHEAHEKTRALGVHVRGLPEQTPVPEGQQSLRGEAHARPQDHHRALSADQENARRSRPTGPAGPQARRAARLHDPSDQGCQNLGRSQARLVILQRICGLSGRCPQGPDRARRDVSRHTPEKHPTDPLSRPAEKAHEEEVVLR